MIAEKDMGLRKAASKKLLYLKTRARSRSFYKHSELILENEPEGEDERINVVYGYSFQGNILSFSPSDQHINLKYVEIETIFEDTLSPTVVKLVRSPESTMVRS